MFKYKPSTNHFTQVKLYLVNCTVDGGAFFHLFSIDSSSLPKNIGSFTFLSFDFVAQVSNITAAASFCSPFVTQILQLHLLNEKYTTYQVGANAHRRHFSDSSKNWLEID